MGHRDQLIIFTRYPEPGKTKTRLIPALGLEGAADLHRRMSEHTLFWARQLQSCWPLDIEIWYAGEGQEYLFRQWLGADLVYHTQGQEDLGGRMAHSFAQAFQAGRKRVILVGTDCPELTDILMRQAFAALEENDVVLGPATDGGYYLIGLRQPVPSLFAGIPWGTEAVLEKTLQMAEAQQLRVFLLEPLPDVDRPQDLPVWERWAHERKVLEPLPFISIIIPTLNEEKNIVSCLASTRHAAQIERIVVDGGSMDRTMEMARTWGATVLSSPKGRARQMNAGARVARGDLLLFLHADTCLPERFAEWVRQILSRPWVAAGAFQFRLDASTRELHLIERGANWRCRLWQMPYGDQAIFVKSALFREVGGFPDIPIMEDFEFIRRLKKKGRIQIAPLPAITSARRWMTLGTWKTTLMHEAIIVAYYLGISPTRIHRWARR